MKLLARWHVWLGWLIGIILLFGRRRARRET